LIQIKLHKQMINLTIYDTFQEIERLLSKHSHAHTKLVMKITIEREMCKTFFHQGSDGRFGTQNHVPELKKGK